MCLLFVLSFQMMQNLNLVDSDAVTIKHDQADRGYTESDESGVSTDTRRFHKDTHTKTGEHTGCGRELLDPRVRR